MAEELSTTSQDIDIIDLIKENMLQDKKREMEYTTILKDYIHILKEEISNKNNIIYRHLNLICREKIVETRASVESNIYNSGILSDDNEVL